MIQHIVIIVIIDTSSAGAEVARFNGSSTAGAILVAVKNKTKRHRVWILSRGGVQWEGGAVDWGSII